MGNCNVITVDGVTYYYLGTIKVITVNVTFSEPVISDNANTKKFNLTLASQTDSTWLKVASCTINDDYLGAVCTYTVLNGEDTGTDELDKSVYVKEFTGLNLFDKSKNQISDYSNTTNVLAEDASNDTSSNLDVSDYARNIHTPKNRVIIVDTLAPVISITRTDPTVNKSNGEVDYYVKENDEYQYEIQGEKVSILKYLSNAVEVTIPETIEGFKVVSIAPYAWFSNHSCLPECLQVLSLRLPVWPRRNSRHRDD